MDQQVVLLHGFGSKDDSWDTFVPYLDANRKYFKVDFSDFSFYSDLTELAHWLNHYFEANHIKKAWIIGHSMGGYLALEFLKNYPDKIVGLGMFHSTASEDSEEKKHNRDRTIAFIEDEGSAAFIKHFYKQMFALPEKHKDLLEKKTQVYGLIPEAALITATKAMKSRADHRDLVTNLKIPVFYIVGQEDNFIKKNDVFEQIASNPNIEALVLSEVGHAGFFESPHLCANFVNDQLMRNKA